MVTSALSKNVYVNLNRMYFMSVCVACTLSKNSTEHLFTLVFLHIIMLICYTLYYW